MPICVKCNKSIKPAGLETLVAGQSYHPTCIQCATCDKPLWGKPFKRTKTGNLVCENPCNPRMRTFTRDDPPPPQTASQPVPQPPTPASARPPSANKFAQSEQRQLSVAIDQQLEQQKLMQFQNNQFHFTFLQNNFNVSIPQCSCFILTSIKLLKFHSQKYG